ncbi:MAG TPA: nitrilase-related carbon-nitrogen hydrolase [Steroidobacteraceae bacterium]|nr:nitrilase-related carbon-nitrogen hydrolase [Steroidobacteraceae bacterium]
MKITVCQLHNAGEALERSWNQLLAHARSEQTELVLLPEMPFSPWLAHAASFKADSWDAALAAHTRFEARFPEIGAATMAGTRPVDFGNGRHNVAFLWDATHGLRSIHAKSQVENREGSWEPIWYVSSPADYTSVEIGSSRCAFLIGAELLATDAIEQYARDGVTLMLTPRSTPAGDLKQWLDVARSAARRAHVFSASSNRAPDGGGWVIDPEGNVIAITDEARPFVTVDLQFPGLPRIARVRRERQAHG